MAFTGTLVLGAVEQALTLYKVVPKVDVEHICIDGHLRMKRIGPDGFHIGLRTTVHDALDRAQLFHMCPCTAVPWQRESAAVCLRFCTEPMSFSDALLVWQPDGFSGWHYE